MTALFACTWALITPAWLTPDEDVHFSYLQTLGERHELPGNGRNPLSSEQFWSMQLTNTDPTVFFLFANPEWSESSYRRWKRSRADESAKDGGGPNAASTYPPAYYLAETPAYLAASSGDIFSRLYAARLWSIVWLLVTTAAVWLLAGEVFGRRRPLQLLAAATVGLWPMVSFMSASVNPDSLFYALGAIFLWLGVAILKDGSTPARVAGLCGAVGLAMITKATALALVPAGLLVLAVTAWRLLRRREMRRAFVVAIVAVACFGAPVATWTIASRSSARPAYAQTGTLGGGAKRDFAGFASYVWQYYLPRLPGQDTHKLNAQGISTYPFLDVWVGTSWAAFGWAAVTFKKWVYLPFLAITLAIALAALVALRRGPPLRRSLPVIAFFAVAAGALLAGLHWNEWQLRTTINQGRYLFPLAGIAGLAVAQACTALPPRLQPYLRGAWLAGLVVFQLMCLGLVINRFYV